MDQLFPVRFYARENVLAFVKERAIASGLEGRFLFHVELAIDEAFTNILHHSGLVQDELVRIECLPISPKGLQITLTDEGIDYCPFSLSTPSDYYLGGFGLRLIHGLMDKVEFSRRNNTNVLTLTKYKTS